MYIVLYKAIALAHHGCIHVLLTCIKLALKALYLIDLFWHFIYTTVLYSIDVTKSFFFFWGNVTNSYNFPFCQRDIIYV